MTTQQKKPLTYAALAAGNPQIKRYVRRLRPERHPHVNSWLRYERAKRDLAPLIPRLPGAYDLVIAEVIRRLKL